MLSAYVILCATSLQSKIESPTLDRKEVVSASITNHQAAAQGQDEKVQTKLLLAPGTPAPDFTVEKWGGGELKLSTFKGKTVVLDFWSTTVPGSISALTHTEAIQKATKEQDVVVLEVNTWDDKANYEAWMKANETTYTLSFGIDPTPKDDTNIAKKLYQVSELPTTYIIDKDGKVADAFVGYKVEDKRLDEALRKLGVKIDQ